MKYETEYRKDHPETIGETDKEFDLSNYSEWLDKQLTSYKRAIEVAKRNLINTIRMTLYYRFKSKYPETIGTNKILEKIKTGIKFYGFVLLKLDALDLSSIRLDLFDGIVKCFRGDVDIAGPAEDAPIGIDVGLLKVLSLLQP